MTGITLAELYDYLSENHEIEFQYAGNTYVIEPDIDNNTDYFVIWKMISKRDALCICRFPCEPTQSEEKNIENFLSEKCLDGSSFLDVERNIHVESVW